MHHLHGLIIDLRGRDVDVRHSRRRCAVSPAALLLDIAYDAHDLPPLAAAKVQMPAERIFAGHVHSDECLADHRRRRGRAAIGSREYPSA